MEAVPKSITIVGGQMCFGVIEDNISDRLSFIFVRDAVAEVLNIPSWIVS